MDERHILARSSGIFADREEAGRLLAEQLRDLEGLRPLVLGIPRGGLPVAREIARSLAGELDVIMTHKIGAQGQSECAVGAVTETGKLFLNGRSGTEDRGYLRAEITRQQERLRRRLAAYRRVLPRAPLEKRRVIVTDDGVATGSTMEAALWAARQEHPAELVAAIPVAAEPSIGRFAPLADRVICLRAPRYFQSVGQFYDVFEQVEDNEVLRILKEEAEKRRSRRPAARNERSAE